MAGRRVGDVNPLRELLLVVQRDGDLGGAGFQQLPAALVDIEAQALRANVVFPAAGSVRRKLPARSEKPPSSRPPAAGRISREPRDTGAVLIHHTPGDRYLRLKAGAHEQKDPGGGRALWGHLTIAGSYAFGTACSLTAYNVAQDAAG